MDHRPANVSARAHARLRATVNRADPRLWTRWWTFLDENLIRSAERVHREEWPSDYWVAQGINDQAVPFIGVSWRDVRCAMDEWPLLGADRLPPPPGAVRTNSPWLGTVLDSAVPAGPEHPPALVRFRSYLTRQPDRRGDVIWIGHGKTLHDPNSWKADYVRAFVTMILGKGLAGIALSSFDDDGLLQTITLNRLVTAFEFGGQVDDAPQLGTWLRITTAIESLYAAPWRDGRIHPVLVDQGMSAESLDAMQWLSHADDPAALLEAVQVAADLLVSPTMARTLAAIARSGDELAPLGLCVLRRWALGLRALAWLEDALSHTWIDVRPADLAMFAYTSLAPWWPRPVMGISHRSADVKPTLAGLELWGDARVAIDAMTVPGWETNTAMVWRLFGATPMIIRVRSAEYERSVWCRREAELTQFLMARSDFLSGRRVIDTPVGELTRMVTVLNSVRTGPDSGPSRREPGTFPPATFVLEVPSHPPLTVNLLAAVGTMRFLNAAYGGRDPAHRIMRKLVSGRRIDEPPPTNHPDGWGIHYEAFSALARVSRGRRPVALRRGYPAELMAHDLETFGAQIPDMRHLACSGIDLFAAMEWNGEVRRWLVDRWGWRRCVIDCRALSAAEWAQGPEHAVPRGMLAIRSPDIVMATQRADQQVDRWAGFADRETPVLTEHVEGQWAWMNRVHTLPTWIVAYLSLPEFEFDHELSGAALADYAGQLRATPGLTMPQRFSDVFGVPWAPGEQLYDLMGPEPGP